MECQSAPALVQKVSLRYVPFRGEKLFMQSRHRFLHAFFLNREREVNTRRSLRDQRDVDVADRTEHARGNTARAAQTFANHANDRASLFNSDGPERFELRNDR